MLYFLPSPSLQSCTLPDKVDSSHPGPEGSAPNYRAAVITEPGCRVKNLNPAIVNSGDCPLMIPVFVALRGANNPIKVNNGYTPVSYTSVKLHATKH